MISFWKLDHSKVLSNTLKKGANTLIQYLRYHIIASTFMHHKLSYFLDFLSEYKSTFQRRNQLLLHLRIQAQPQKGEITEQPKQQKNSKYLKLIGIVSNSRGCQTSDINPKELKSYNGADKLIWMPFFPWS